MTTQRRDFCIECRKQVEYTLQKRNIIKTIKDKEYLFTITVAICSECGEEMSIPGLIDKNIKEIDEQYRIAENLISMDDIVKLSKIYNLGKAPLSLALGFGEITITRYLSGQVPSKEYSDIMKSALTSYAYMKKLLIKNKDKIAETAYLKAMESVDSLERLFCVSEKILRVIYYIFERMEEVTPLMLQKLLYFIQGTGFVTLGRSMFVENCEAWVHGPVYPEVYRLFKDFKYNPIDDVRFAILDGTADALTEEERKTIDLVVDTFGIYSGKVLEKITHKETPWRIARRGYEDSVPSREVVTKESIKAYFEEKNEEYDMGSEDGLKNYIQDMLERE